MKTGRPELRPEERRTERHNLRFTQAEHEHIRAQASAAGLDVAEYLRRRALGYVVPASPARRVGSAAVLSELNRIGLEMKAIGNNANQLALSAHTKRRSRIAWEGVVGQIGDSLGELERTMRTLTSGESFDADTDGAGAG